MPEYVVKWEIDITADTPREAAEHALRAQRRPGSIATVFDVVDVTDRAAIHPVVRIDLDEDE